MPLSKRISTFLEVVPALLEHLNIKHISLASHSAGTIFCLNLLAAHPELLDPSCPSVTFIAPWVHQSLSGNLWLAAAALLPNKLLDYVDNLWQLNRLRPKVHVLLSMCKRRATRQEEWSGFLDCFGVTQMTMQMRREFQSKCAFLENMAGANDEARLCLKSVRGQCHWGAAEDYDDLVANLKQAWGRRVVAGEQKLNVNIMFPWKDAFIGVRGMEYFEDCWTLERCQDSMEVMVTNGFMTDHDSVIGCAMIPMFEAAKSGTAWNFDGDEEVPPFA